MKLLAIETSTDACSAAVWIDGAVHERFELAPGQHSQLILNMVDAVLAEAGVALADLDALAFGRGPGSFTGLRIAAGVIQGLAYGVDRPVVPVSTLAALAQAAWESHGQPRVLAALDARMKEIYWAAYERDTAGNWCVVAAECVVAPEQAEVPPAAPGTWFGIGPGWAAYEAVLRARAGGRLGGCDSQTLPRAAHLLPLAALEFARGAAVNPALALPVYLRDRVAHAK